MHTRHGHPPASTDAAAEVDPKGRHLATTTDTSPGKDTNPDTTRYVSVPLRYVSVPLKRHTKHRRVTKLSYFTYQFKFLDKERQTGTVTWIIFHHYDIAMPSVLLTDLFISSLIPFNGTRKHFLGVMICTFYMYHSSSSSYTVFSQQILLSRNMKLSILK